MGKNRLVVNFRHLNYYLWKWNLSMRICGWLCYCLRQVVTYFLLTWIPPCTLVLPGEGGGGALCAYCAPIWPIYHLLDFHQAALPHHLLLAGQGV